MTITYTFIEDAILSHPGVTMPQLDVCDNSSTFSLLRLQCKADIIANHNDGPRFENTDYLVNLLPEALQIARSKFVDLFITPEYSFPINMLEKIISSPDLQPVNGKLWCICIQGSSVSEFDDFFSRLKADSRLIILSNALDTYRRKMFVNALIYIFKLSDGRICMAPQIKTRSMADRNLDCEEVGLSLGNVIFRFGKDSPNHLLSLICADTLNEREVNVSKLFEKGNECLILLHPQLNMKPRHEDFSSLRRSLFRGNEGNRLVYITQNWAEGSSLALEGDSAASSLDSPWSCIYSKNNDRSWFDNTKLIRRDNHQKGLGFAYWDDKRTNIWFSEKMELMQLLQVRKPCQTGPVVATPSVDVKCLQTYIPNDVRNHWIEKECIFKEDISDIDEMLSDPYKYPITASLEDRDYFFGISLGQSIEGQLIADKEEYCQRLGLNIDIYSSLTRNRGVSSFINLTRCLQDKKLPEHFRNLIEEHKFSLNRTNGHNLISIDNNSSAVVSFVEDETSAIRVADKLIRDNGEHNKEKVCVFTPKIGNITKIITYPIYDHSIVATDRVKESSKISEG